MNSKAYQTVIEQVGDLIQYVGKEIGISDWYQITQHDIDQFATLTKDEQWIHIDVSRCQEESPFNKTIAHGFLVLSFCSYFAQQCIDIRNTKMGINYGFDKVRFTNTVKEGSHIRGRFTLLTMEQEVDRVKFKYGVQIEINGEDKPACVAEWLGLLYV